MENSDVACLPNLTETENTYKRNAEEMIMDLVGNIFFYILFHFFVVDIKKKKKKTKSDKTTHAVDYNTIILYILLRGMRLMYLPV